MKRSLNVAYKTAWYLCHRIRTAMTDTTPQSLAGIVEVDETWVGGKRHGMGAHAMDNKTAVAGALERGGAVRLKKLKDVKRCTLQDFLRSNTDDKGADRIMTDELRSYRGIEQWRGTHVTVNHSIEYKDLIKAHVSHH